MNIRNPPILANTHLKTASVFQGFTYAHIAPQNSPFHALAWPVSDAETDRFKKAGSTFCNKLNARRLAGMALMAIFYVKTRVRDKDFREFGKKCNTLPAACHLETHTHCNAHTLSQLWPGL